jgi:uncharacterized membrane-anchored protein YitT (DUF2179 family)
MNKIVLNFGLLIFFLSIVFFSQRGLPLEDVAVRSLTIFFSVTVLMAILAIFFVKAVNKTSLEKREKLNDKLIGNNKNE